MFRENILSVLLIICSLNLCAQKTNLFSLPIDDDPNKSLTYEQIMKLSHDLALKYSNNIKFTFLGLLSRMTLSQH